MYVLVWIMFALAASVAFHARLAGWTMAPDLPLALVAWAVVCGDTQRWIWRVWLIGPVRDVVDPGSTWFHAGLHLAMVVALIPSRRWIPVHPTVALAVVGVCLSAVTQAVDLLISGPGGWDPWIGSANAALTAIAAMGCGWLVPIPKRTVTLAEAPAESVPLDQPAETAGR